MGHRNEDERARKDLDAMTTRQLFLALSDLTTALAAEAERLRFSPHKLALEALRERLDGLLDQIIDEGVHDAQEETAC